MTIRVFNRFKDGGEGALWYEDGGVDMHLEILKKKAGVQGVFFHIVYVVQCCSKANIKFFTESFTCNCYRGWYSPNVQHGPHCILAWYNNICNYTRPQSRDVSKNVL